MCVKRNTSPQTLFHVYVSNTDFSCLHTTGCALSRPTALWLELWIQITPYNEQNDRPHDSTGSVSSSRWKSKFSLPLYWFGLKNNCNNNILNYSSIWASRRSLKVCATCRMYVFLPLLGYRQFGDSSLNLWVDTRIIFTIQYMRCYLKWLLQRSKYLTQSHLTKMTLLSWYSS